MAFNRSSGLHGRGAVLSVAFLLVALPLLGDTPAAGSAAGIIDEWYAIELQGKPAGYRRWTSTPLQGGGYLVAIEEELSMKRDREVARARKKIAIEEDAAGKLLSFRVEQWLSDEPTRIEGVARDGRFHMKRSDGGGPQRESEIPIPPDALGDRRLREVLKTALGKKGDRTAAVVFLPEPEFLRFAKQTFLVSDAVDPAPGRGKRLHVESSIDILPGIVQNEIYDGDLALQSLSLEVAGLRFAMKRSTMKEVLEEDYGSPPEIFLSMAVRPRGKSSRGAREAEYVLSLREGSFQGPDVFRAAGQEVLESRGPASRVVRVRRTEPSSSVARPVPAPGGMEDCLRPNAYIQSDQKRIVDVARHTAGEEKDAWKAAVALERWVHEHIREKDLKVPFATAAEVVESRKGDCTEHAVLLAALLRASGIPSRVAAGLVESQGQFVGHMWTEAWLGDAVPGGWVVLDATRGRGDVAADRLAFGVSSLETSDLPRFFLEVLLALGKLDMEVRATR